MNTNDCRRWAQPANCKIKSIGKNSKHKINKAVKRNGATLLQIASGERNTLIRESSQTKAEKQLPLPIIKSKLTESNDNPLIWQAMGAGSRLKKAGQTESKTASTKLTKAVGRRAQARKSSQSRKSSNCH